MRARFQCRNNEERGRVLDMTRRLAPASLCSSLMLLVAGIAMIPTFGWLWLAPGAAAAGVVAVVSLRVESFQRPELALLGQWVAVQALLAASVALASGPRQYLLMVLVVPAVFCSVILPARAMVPFVGLTLAMIAAVALGWQWDLVARTPPVLAVPVIGTIVLTMTAGALGRVDAQSRSTAIVDQLTGVLNRMALMPRAAEVAHQAAATGAPVAVIIGDVDSFKAINDGLGHSSGDAALREVARRLSDRMGASAPVYRFGGEEFVVLLPGCDLAGAAQVAEDLRVAVCAAPILGRAVTMSFGVAASCAGSRFDFEDVFATADDALYEAKRGGRDRVAARASVPELEATAARRAREAAPRSGRRRRAVAQQPGRHLRERMQREREKTGNWLVRDQVQREHMLALNALLGKNFRRAGALTFLAIIVSAPWFGWVLLVPPVLAGVVYNLIQIRLSRLHRPEYALALAWLLMQVGTTAGFMLARGAPLFALPLFVLMVLGSAAVFPRHAVVIGTAATAGLMVAAAYVLAGHRFPATPAVLISPLVLLGLISLVGSAVGRSAIHYRGAAVIDELTGALSRNALRARTAELTHQSVATGEQVALILADLDHFKTVNDEHGHARGDAVLREVAYRIRKQLRAFESVYRIGGEEFAILLAGADSEEATRVAQRIWRAIHAEAVDGLPVTTSCGVAVTEAGEAFDYGALFAIADAALYEAKRAGRDCIRVHASLEPALAA